MGHLESLTISARWKGVYDLTEIWKDYGGSLFIHVNSDLSEISQEQLWLLDTLASWKDEGSESEEAEEFRL